MGIKIETPQLETPDQHDQRMKAHKDLVKKIEQKEDKTMILVGVVLVILMMCVCLPFLMATTIIPIHGF